MHLIVYQFNILKNTIQTKKNKFIVMFSIIEIWCVMFIKFESILKIFAIHLNLALKLQNFLIEDDRLSNLARYTCLAYRTTVRFCWWFTRDFIE